MCALGREGRHFVRAPAVRIVRIRTWGFLPYILKDDLNLILNDLSDIQEVGRSGQPAETPMAARVSRLTSSPQVLRSHLRHLQGDFSNKASTT